MKNLEYLSDLRDLPDVLIVKTPLCYPWDPCGFYRSRTKYNGRLFVHFVHHQGVTPSPSHNTSTGPMSFLGVPHLHPIILPLVPCPFPGGVPQWLVPGPIPGGTPVPGGGTSVPDVGYPSPRWEWKGSPIWGKGLHDGVPPGRYISWGFLFFWQCCIFHCLMMTIFTLIHWTGHIFVNFTNTAVTYFT